MFEKGIKQLREEVELLREEKVRAKDEVSTLRNDVSMLNDRIEQVLKLYNEKIKATLENRLIEFHKDITDKYFGTLDKVLHFNTELSVIGSLANRMNDKELYNMKRELLRPSLEAKWKEKELKQGDKALERTKHLGDDLVRQRKELHDKKLQMEKMQQNTEFIDGQINILDLIIGGDSEK